ncbi:MAG TPA: asparagine--tRNA ligase, partial [Saprospirales bacterium]|nr:asparagine--tRNA ligase [Saprospirales bacterium]
FIALNDGSTIKTLQVVIDQENEDFALLKRFTVGAAIKATGRIIESQGKGQSVELVAETL